MAAVNYLWNPLNDNIVREFDDGGAVVAEYTTEPEEFGNVISQRRDGEDDYFHYDGVGSTVAVTNQAGTLTDTRAYTAFGETTEQSGTTVFPFQYLGRQQYLQDDRTHLLDARRRWYDASHGRWLSVDPIENEGGRKPYDYVGNTPINDVDPSGLFRVGKPPLPGTCVYICTLPLPGVGVCDLYLWKPPPVCTGLCVRAKKTKCHVTCPVVHQSGQLPAHCKDKWYEATADTCEEAQKAIVHKAGADGCHKPGKWMIKHCQTEWIEV